MLRNGDLRNFIEDAYSSMHSNSHRSYNISKLEDINQDPETNNQVIDETNNKMPLPTPPSRIESQSVDFDGTNHLVATEAVNNETVIHEEQRT
jgi:hypothetical protein